MFKEKCMQPYELIIFGLCCGILIFSLIVLIVIFVVKGRDQTWTGTVLMKHLNQIEDMDTDATQDNYFLDVQLDNGSTAKIAVNKNLFNRIKEGDRLRKEKGQMWPKIIVEG